MTSTTRNYTDEYGMCLAECDAACERQQQALDALQKILRIIRDGVPLSLVYDTLESLGHSESDITWALRREGVRVVGERRGVAA